MTPGAVLRNRGKEWLLDIHRLKAKLALFRNITFPSVTRNSHLPDLYLILIDPELPTAIRDELELLIQPYRFIKLFVCPQEISLNYSRINWIRDIHKIKAEFIITSNLDDDDALSLDYIRKVQEKSILLIEEGVYFHWMGTKKVEDWDIPSEIDDSSLGFLKPNSNEVDFLYSPGLSLLSPNLDEAFSVFCLGHHSVTEVFERNPKGYRHHSRKELLRLNLSFFINMILANYPVRTALKALAREGIVHDISNKSDPKALMTNHGDNLQLHRINVRIKQRIEIDDAQERKLHEKYGVFLSKALEEFTKADQKKKQLDRERLNN